MALLMSSMTNYCHLELNFNHIFLNNSSNIQSKFTKKNIPVLDEKFFTDDQLIAGLLRNGYVSKLCSV